MLESVKVRDYMTRHLVTFEADSDLFTAINRLLEHRIAGMPGCRDAGGRRGKLVGQISRHDVLLAVKEFAQHEQGRYGATRHG